MCRASQNACRVMRAVVPRVAYRVHKLAKPFSRIAYKIIACRVSRESASGYAKLACLEGRFRMCRGWSGTERRVGAAESCKKYPSQIFIGKGSGGRFVALCGPHFLLASTLRSQMASFVARWPRFCKPWREAEYIPRS